MKLMQYDTGVFYTEIGLMPVGDGRGQRFSLGTRATTAGERGRRIEKLFLASGREWRPETLAQARLIARGKA
jgi:hypothetical protein